MNIATLLGLNTNETQVILIGVPEITNILDSDEQPYYAAKLKNPITVRCSVDPEIIPYETEEVYIRKAALDSEDWIMVNEKDPADGYYMKNWVVDFSKGQQIAIYQSESIKKWARGNREGNREITRRKINDALRQKIADKKKD